MGTLWPSAITTEAEQGEITGKQTTIQADGAPCSPPAELRRRRRPRWLIEAGRRRTMIINIGQECIKLHSWTMVDGGGRGGGVVAIECNE